MCAVSAVCVLNLFISNIYYKCTIAHTIFDVIFELRRWLYVILMFHKFIFIKMNECEKKKLINY